MFQALKLIFTRDLHLLFFGVFLLTFPLSSWRKIMALFPLVGFSGFNEYTSITLSVSDIFFLLTLLFIIIEHKNNILSIIREKMFHVEQRILFSALIFIIVAFISLFYSNQRELGFYAWLRLVEMFILFLYLSFLFVPRGTKSTLSHLNTKKYIFFLLIFSALFQSSLGILQFFSSSSLHLHFLGESILSINMPGVAKIVFGESFYLRAYGTFLHPNILGGFLFLSLLSLLYGKKVNLFHVERRLYYVFLGILLLGLFLTFSKSALIAFLFSLGILCSTWNKTTDTRENVPLGTKPLIPEKMFHVEHVLFIITLLWFLFILFFQNQHFLTQSMDERLFLLPPTQKMISSHIFSGVGIGEYVSSLPVYGDFLSWKIQPIHNMYILILAETGIFGLITFLFFLKKLFWPVPRGTWGNYVLALGVGFLFIGSVDHYLWDIEQGRIMLVYSWALLSSTHYLTKL